MAEFRDWRAPYKVARERLLEARRNRVAPQPFSQDGTPQEVIGQIVDAQHRSERAAEFNPAERVGGELRTPIANDMAIGRMKKTTPMKRGGVVFGSKPGTKAFYREKGVQAPEPYIERIDDFGEGGGGRPGGIQSTILSGKSGEALKDQQGARRRMGQGAVTRHARAVANSEPAVESDLP